MASLDQLAEDLFTCTLCLEKLRDPRTLQCLHTFCRNCIASYISTTSRDWTYWCPVCEVEFQGKVQGVTVRTVDECVENLVSNPFLVRISDVKEGRTKDKACHICRHQRVSVDAAFWCQQCLEMLCEDCHRVHSKSKASRHHKVITVDELQNETLEKLIKPPATSLKCPEHRENVLEFVCADCKQASCQMCVATLHAKCRRIDKMEKLSPNLRTDMHEAKRRVEACRSECINHADDVTRHLNSLTTSRDEALHQLTSLKEKLMDLINDRETKAVSQIEAAYSRQRDLLCHVKRSCDVKNLALRRSGQFLTNLLAFGTDVDILRNFDVIVKHVTYLEKDQSPSVSRASPTIVKYSIDKKSTEFLRHTAALGEVKFAKGSNRASTAADSSNENNLSIVALNPKGAVAAAAKGKQVQAAKLTKGQDKAIAKATNTKQEVNNQANSSIVTVTKGEEATATKKPKLISTFSGRFNSDTMKTDLRGIVCLPDDSVVVMDVQFRNKRLKKFNQRGKFISHFDPGECPSSMTLTSDTDLVVTLPKIKEFVFVSASGTLQLSGRIKTSKAYYVIASSPDGVIAAIATPANAVKELSVDLISLTGEMLHTIPLDRIRFPSPPISITLTPCGLVYLLFNTVNEVFVSLTYQGEIMLSYNNSNNNNMNNNNKSNNSTKKQSNVIRGRQGGSPSASFLQQGCVIKRPISLQCDVTDNAYIADLEGHVIHVLGPDGSNLGTVVGKRDGVKDPLSFCLMEGGGIAVAQKNGDIKLFNLDRQG